MGDACKSSKELNDHRMDLVLRADVLQYPGICTVEKSTQNPAAKYFHPFGKRQVVTLIKQLSMLVEGLMGDCKSSARLYTHFARVMKSSSKM